MQETAAITAGRTTTDPIDHSMLVAEVNRRYPQCQRVFEKHGIAGCGGPNGPPEPLFIFAAAHRVPLPQLVKELNQALRGEWREEIKQRKTESDAVAEAREQYASENLYKWFVAAALLVALTMGFTLGMINLTRIALAQNYYAISGVLKQAHGHAQIFGWVGLFVMGVAFHAIPRFKSAPLKPFLAARACLVLMLTGVLMRSVAQPFARNGVGRFTVLGSGVLELVAIGLFVWLIGKAVATSKQPHDFYEKFIWAGVVWFAGTWQLEFLGLLRTWFAHRAAGSPHCRTRSGSTWPCSDSLRISSSASRCGCCRTSSVCATPRCGRPTRRSCFWNAAIFLRYPVERLAWAASTLEAVAIVLFVWALGIFARRRTKIEIKGVDNTFAWFVKLGYGWLLMVALIPFHADVFRLSASARHTMAVGFVTPIRPWRGVSGFANLQRREPVEQSADARLVLDVGARAARLAFSMAFNRVFETTWSYAWSGIAGFLVLAAILMFAINIALTLRTKAEKFTREAMVKLNTRVVELLEAYPDLRPVLIHGGLSGSGHDAAQPAAVCDHRICRATPRHRSGATDQIAERRNRTKTKTRLNHE